MKRLSVAVALVLIVVLGAGSALLALRPSAPSASGGGPTPVPLATGGPAAPAPDPALASYYSQTLQWSDCDNGDQCAQLTVPLDYARPAGRTIELHVLKVPAADPGSRLGSLVVNPGGPGEPGTSYAVQGDFGQPLRDHFDIVGFDPRGTGSSSPVDCLSDSALDTYLAEDPDPTTPAELATFEAEQRAIASGCPQLSGAIAGHVSTVESARDMDILRAALGDTRMTYLGASYGTKLGATYAQLFPRRVGRFVLDGALDLTLSNRDQTLQQAAGFQKALESYAANCVAADIGCFLGKTVPDVLTTISDLVARITAKPLPAQDGRVLTGGNAFSGIAVTLYSRSYWVLLSSALRSALGGDGSLLLRLADAYTARNSDGTYANNSMEAFYDISCLDDPTSIPFSQVPSQFPAFDQASPLFGRVFAWGLTSCRGFTPRSDQPVPTVHAKGAAPIVVIGTTRDPATPFQWAVAMAHQLDSGVLVRRNGDGHTGYRTGNACVDNAVESYLVSGIVPKNRTSC
ncbi:alpha/beta hydrolase [Nocardioides cynanchi]|uniref:alpha/beta hydrolase n=1 Tax=Nocardioides cynanchi TaxID=2558918 RepID=UPI001247763C|nr:alpha/beta hydrolase [Nocardioides cynanchi]